MAHVTETSFLDASGTERMAATLDGVQGYMTAATALVLDTSAYSSGDLLVETQSIPNAFRTTDGSGRLDSLVLIDEDDQGAALDIYFMDAAVSFGTKNSAPSPTDTQARSVLCMVPIATSDYKDLGGVRIATKLNIGAIVQAVAGTANLYVAVVNGTGTPTYTVNGLRLRLGIK